MSEPNPITFACGCVFMAIALWLVAVGFVMLLIGGSGYWFWMCAAGAAIYWVLVASDSGPENEEPTDAR